MSDAELPGRKASEPDSVERALSFGIVITGFSLVTLAVVEFVGGPQNLGAMVESAGPWAPLLFIVLKACTMVFAPLSGTSLQLAGGALFGTWNGALLIVAGDTLGGSISYWIARTVGRKGVVRFAGKKALGDIDAVAHRVGGWRALLVARVVFNPVYDFVCYAAGLSNLRFRTFVAVTAIGGLVPALFFGIVGSSTANSASANYATIAIIGGAFVALCVAYGWRRRVRKST